MRCGNFNAGVEIPVRSHGDLQGHSDPFGNRSETVRKPFGNRSESVRNPFGIRSNPFGPVRDMLGTRRKLFYPCGCCFARSAVVLTRIIAISSVELFLERFGGCRYILQNPQQQPCNQFARSDYFVQPHQLTHATQSADAPVPFQDHVSLRFHGMLQVLAFAFRWSRRALSQSR